MTHRPFSDDVIGLLNAAVWYVERCPPHARQPSWRLLEIDRKSLEEMQKRLAPRMGQADNMGTRNGGTRTPPPSNPSTPIRD